jgi:UPF0176 protein
MTIPSNDVSPLSTHYISTFYKFFPVSQPENIQAELEAQAQNLELKGLIILGPEGLNATVSCENHENLEVFKKYIQVLTQDHGLQFKDSTSITAPFRRFRTKIREEIVTLGTPELVPSTKDNHHLSPEEWNRVMKEEDDYVIIDTRNWYETKIGTFKGALNPHTDKFTAFPEFMEKNNFPKEKKMLIFCTGGIRCEKGILELQRQGYDNVYQLQGGILNYLEKFPEDQFEGECFVFDHRVAVDQKLQPSKQYDLCPHCGQPGKSEISCKRCDSHAIICEDCAEKEWIQHTCSKNCAHHLKLHPDRKGLKQHVPWSPQA